MSKLKNFAGKHSELFSIQFFVFVGLLILCIIFLVMCRDRGEDSVIQDDPATTTPPVNDQINEPDRPELEFTNEEATESNIDDFVTLGQTRGISYNRSVVTQQDIDDFIAQHLAEGAMMKEVTGRAVRDGDMVVIDYVGFLGDEPFPGGADQDAELWIGSGSFIPGFEEQIIGHSIGEQFDINLAFPDDYHAPELAGQDVVFEITLKGIFEEGAAELDDEFVRELGLGSVEEYLNVVRERLEEDALNEDKRQVFNLIVEQSVFHKIPISELEQRIATTMEQFHHEAETYDIDIEDFIREITQGMSYDEFIELEVRPYAINDVQMDLVIRAISFKEGISISDEEFMEGVMGYVEQFGYDDAEQFLQYNPESTVRIALLADKVIEFLMEFAVPN